MTFSFLMIGCGEMGRAMLSGWMTQAWVKEVEIAIIKPSMPKEANQDSVKWYCSLEDYSNMPDIILLAVKPQTLKEVLPTLQKRFGIKPLYISIAAGITCKSYQQAIGNEVRLVRAMPNTPVSVGLGLTTMVATRNVTDIEREFVENLFLSLGTALWLDSESQINLTTAIAGCGPAYVYLFMEALIHAAVERGLSADIAQKLVLQTLYGATTLANKSSHSPEILREQVTSKGGMTEAALQQLTQDDILFSIMSNAIKAAISRGDALNSALSLS